MPICTWGFLKKNDPDFRDMKDPVNATAVINYSIFHSMKFLKQVFNRLFSTSAAGLYIVLFAAAIGVARTLVSNPKAQI